MANNLAPALKTLSFEYESFTKGDGSITLQGDVDIVPDVEGVLQLTQPDNYGKYGVGRALYPSPLVIWDDLTHKVASFETTFFFSIQQDRRYTPADGIVFFLAPVGTQIPENSSGGRLGIINAGNAFNQFVAVEYDTYSNEWDPSDAHIGINVNSLISLQTAKWHKVDGALVKATITYDSSTKTLTASAEYPNNANTPPSTVSQVIDLKAVLPAKVNIGLAAAQSTGGREFHNIHSWSFSTTHV